MFRPCKTVSRIIVAAWGADTSVYPGRSMTLYRDPAVKWAGMAVGGIRVKAISHIDAPLKLALAESKQNRKITVVQPLKVSTRDAAVQSAASTKDDVTLWAEALVARIKAAESAEAILAIENEATVIKRRQWIEGAGKRPDLAAMIAGALAAGPAVQSRADTDHGDQFPADDADDLINQHQS